MQKKVRERKRGKKKEKISMRKWREISVSYELAAPICDFILNIDRTRRLFILFLELDFECKSFGLDSRNLNI